MALNKFYGAIGYGESVETTPGVWEDDIVEYNYYGDVVKNSRGLQESGEKVNDDLTVNNSISIVADAYANEHFHAIRYIRWAGTLWKVSDVDASQPPRLILRLGKVYNGPKASTPVTP